MRLHRLVLTNVRGVTHREVVFPDAGIVVLEGANEVGKTSMIEALDLVFDYKDNSRDRRLAAIRPVGQDAGSAVEVEMSSGRYRFTYRKQWFKNPSTTLTLQLPAFEHLVGAAAHERVVALLSETADLALWKALRLMQATPLAPAELGESTALASALDGAGGRCTDPGAEGDSLVAAAQESYVRYFTARAGAETGDYRAARERLAAARLAEGAAREALEEVARDVARHDQVTAEYLACDDDIREAEREAAVVAERWRETSELVETVGRLLRDVEHQRGRLDRSQDLLRERTRLIEAIQDRERRSAEASNTADDLAAALAPAESELAALLTDCASTEGELDVARARADQARRHVVYLRDVADAAALEERLHRLDDLVLRRREARATVSRSTVDDTALARIESAVQALRIAEAGRRATSGSVTLTGLGPGLVLVDGIEVTLFDALRSEHALDGRLTVEVPGLLSLTVTPGAGADGPAEAVRVAEEELAVALAAAQAPDVEAARAMNAARRDALAERDRAEDALGAVLGADTEESLRDRLCEVRATVSAYEEEMRRETAHRDDTADGGDLSVDPRRAAEQAQETQASYQELQLRHDATVRAVAGLRGHIDAGRTALVRSEAERDALAAQVEEDRTRLEAARVITSDEALAENAGVETEAHTALTASVVVAQEQLRQADPDVVQARAVAATAAVEAHRRRRQGLHEERITIEAHLEQFGSQGRSEAYDAAASELAQAERTFRAVDRRAKAARLLHETLQMRRNEAKRAYVEPFRAAVVRLGRVVFGAGFSVEVADDLTVQARILDGRRIPFQDLSTGAKEQLAILTRLACASLVDGDAGAPVVIDDALGYSDPERLRRVGAAFGMIGRDTQVLLLTCTPGRYAGIPAAEVIRL